MKLHVIIDFSHIYYKYFFRLSSGKLKRLSAPINWNGTVIEKDTSLIYYPLKDIENIRRNLELAGHDVTMSICFDMPSMRKDGDTSESKGYKSNRTKRFSDEDYKNIQFVQELLTKAGHNTYRYDGYEADDLVNHLVNNYKNNFEYTVIYTNDKDLLVNIADNVGCMRYKTSVGYSQVDRNNYESYTEPEFKARIPYNAISLYLATVGDSADVIKGINKFGPKAFEKLVNKLNEKYSINWSECGDYDKMMEVIHKCEGILTEVQMEELLNSFALVASINIIDDVPAPTNKTSLEKRKLAYNEYNMISLCP